MKKEGRDFVKSSNEFHILWEWAGAGRGIPQDAAELRQEDGVYGSLDFNKLIPMPEPMNIESGTWTNQGLQAYRSFMAGPQKCGNIQEGAS